jgi:hypothetical protein
MQLIYRTSRYGTHMPKKVIVDRRPLAGKCCVDRNKIKIVRFEVFMAVVVRI